MRLSIVASILASILAAGGTALALPNPDTRFRPGANHHGGDASFIEQFHRAPTIRDSERVRMRVHLEHVRAWLASRPPTRPELATRRAELLGYLDDYIAKGTTPANTHLPWRTAVFIDDAGTICAVGYLLERSAGRALPERIAAAHRYDFLEDIAAAMPDVARWIAGSGFTLEELASIQPAYESANVRTWRTWDLPRHAPPDGPFANDTVTGTFANHAMHGTWTVKNSAGIVIGTGDLVHGAGTWRSYQPDGKQLLAEGPYVHNVAHGAWTFFHASGNVAAEGNFVRGMRSGRWRFYRDTKAKQPIAIGAFDDDGHVFKQWRHYDDDGSLVAITYAEGRGDRVDVVPAAGITHQLHQFTDGLNGPVEEYTHQLERFVLGAEQVYVDTSGYRGGVTASDTPTDPSIIYDAAGFRLEHAATGWTAAKCPWSPKRIGVARSGNLAWLHEILFAESAARGVEQRPADGFARMLGDPGPRCGTPVAVSPARSATLDTLLAAHLLRRAQDPTFVREVVLDAKAADSELRHDLAAYTINYVEWPHVDGRFEDVFTTMAGRLKWEWYQTEPEADGTSPKAR
ncbi:MAG: hypothetical protein ABI867_06125 [Kofleriaceae bacterium]